MNTQYNKGIYTGLAGAVLTSIFLGLKFYANHEVPTELQGAITTVVLMTVAILVPNKEKADK